ncbi:MAG: elongation factor-1 alpha [Hydrogenothermus sp.]|nr:MAG: elongation factor-1 alpha [Hydrogenothermus sp.]
MEKDKKNTDGGWLNLTRISLPVKVLFTGYLIVIGIGLMIAGLQILLTHGMADGKFGISVKDIVYSYYGNREGSKLEKALNGSMKQYATPEERAILIEWVRKGAPDDEYETKVKPIIQNNCSKCHGVIPSIPNLTKKEVLKELAKVDTGATIGQLTRLSHIHLFGMAFIFMFLGFIFSFAVGVNKIIKSILIFTPFAFQLIDITAWWLTKIWPNFAYFVIIGGFGYFTASTLMILISLYQMWIMKPRDENAWRS